MDEMWGSDRERFRFKIDYLIRDWDNDWKWVKFGWDIRFELVVKQDLWFLGFVRTIFDGWDVKIELRMI